MKKVKALSRGAQLPRSRQGAGVLTTKDAAVLALLSKKGVPRATQRVMLGRLRGEAKKIAKHLTGGVPSSAQVRRAAEELRKFSAPVSARVATPWSLT